MKSRGIWDDSKEAALAEKVEADTAAIVKRAEGIEDPDTSDFFTSIFAEVPEDLALQMQTRRTSSIGEDPSQIESPETANG